MKRQHRKMTPLIRKQLKEQKIRLNNACLYPSMGKSIATTKGTFYSNVYEQKL